MTEDALIERILANTFTKNDLYKRFLLAQDFLAQAHYGADSGGDALSSQLLARYQAGPDRETSEAIAAWGDECLGTLAATKDADALKRRIAALPDLVLYVPVAFDARDIALIAQWCRKNVNAAVLLELRIDPDSAGGCMIVWKSVLYDFSLRYFFRRHAPELGSMIQRVCSSGELAANAAAGVRV